MKDFAVFVSSSDNYSDIWNLFFDLFHKYWPEYNGTIYLQTQEKEYSHPNLNIICTKVGKLKYFGETLRAGLNKIPNENILLIMIDYIFMGKVNHKMITAFYDFFCQKNLDSLCLRKQSFNHFTPSHNPLLIKAEPPTHKIMFGYQIAFWKRELLHEMALPHENPWMSEWYGSERAEKMNLHIECLRNDKDAPIIYDMRGCLHQGKWLENAVTFLNDQKYAIDFSKRGLYNDDKGYRSLKYRIKIKWVIFKTGIMGSYWDLLKRKKIH